MTNSQEHRPLDRSGSFSALLLLNVSIKAALVVLLVFGAFSGLEQFEGKAFGWRLGTYPIWALVVPVAWWARYRESSYPHLADALLVTPMLVDVIGNAVDLYDTIAWWDDANHFVNWMVLTLGAGALGLRTRLEWPVLALLLVGFGAVTAVIWELAEYATFIHDSPELATTYEDTLGDLALGCLGAVVAAVVIGLRARFAVGQRVDERPGRELD